jgi:(R,R)-butanediol dehydrogenase/meso-butanediol dehydrogenase/diacetyl reductase
MLGVRERFSFFDSSISVFEEVPVMKQAVYHGARDVRVEEVEEPQVDAGQVKVKVRYCGICGSDLHEYLHGPFPVSPFGHEVVGEVVEVGPEVEDVGVGDRVAAFNRDGYAEFQVSTKDQIMKLPDDMDWQRLALLEPLAGAAYAVERGAIKPEDTVFIAGAGPVGLLVLMALRAVGVSTVYVSEISPPRRRKAEELGATATIDPTEMKVSKAVKELTDGRGADVSIEAVGVETALKDCLTSTRYQGTVVVDGIFTERVPIHMLGFVTQETTMIGCNSINPSLALEWMQTKDIAPESIVTSIVPLDDIVGRAFEVLTTDKDREIKVLVEP